MELKRLKKKEEEMEHLREKAISKYETSVREIDDTTLSITAGDTVTRAADDVTSTDIPKTSGRQWAITTPQPKTHRQMIDNY